MSEFNICTLNCRGLGDYRKRRDVFHYLRNSAFHIYMLQDIHCGPNKVNVFRNAWGTDILIAPYTGNARGVAILTKGIKFKVCASFSDPGGNYIIAKVIINDTQKIILANIYGPNEDNPAFYEELGNIFQEIEDDDTPVIIGGDFNLTLNGTLDTKNYVGENNTRARDMLLRLMDTNGWIDIFRERNGDDRRFTWRNTGPVIKQGRLDFFIISRGLIPFVLEENIVSGYRTDHSMVTLKIDILKQARGKGFFKINNSLLQHEDFSAVIRKVILDTIHVYSITHYQCMMS